MIHLYPQPDDEGIRNMKRVLREKYAREVSDDEARQILARIMRYLYLMYWPHADDGPISSTSAISTKTASN